MKIKFFILSLMVLPIFMSAQSRSIEKFFEAHKDNDDYTLIEISGNLFNMTKNKDKANKKIRIDGFQLLSAPKGSSGISLSEVRGFANQIKNENFEDLITVRDSDTRFNFMVQESNGIISELVMIADEDDSITIMSLRGKIPTEELDNLYDEVEIDGLEKLKKN
ncbi:MAG: DUF4252 domain-containing protein [Bacteroidia bacterium]|nr:DUF4252 domain-containing protein [Bacteroidia bacterium]